MPVYLLDTNVAANSPADREITGELYGGDNEMRLKQEILLGIGGYRALEAAQVQPAVYHMNEGHSAFLSLEHVRRLMERYRLSFAEARELASLQPDLHRPHAGGSGARLLRAGLDGPLFHRLLRRRLGLSRQ